jgi:hypothetical protein
MAHPMDYAAPDNSKLAIALDAAINSPDIHGKKTRSACSSSIHFRDALRVVAQQMNNLPGRKVILAISDGYDGGSYVKPQEILTQLKADYVTIFGLTDSSSAYLPFLFLCPITGGSMISTSDDELQKHLEHFNDLLRSRNIIKCPESADLTKSKHRIEIRIDDKRVAYIIPGGLQVVMAIPTGATPDKPKQR